MMPTQRYGVTPGTKETIVTTTATTTIRAPRQVKDEVAAMSHLLGCTSAELVEAAWDAYRSTPEFGERFAEAQKAFATGNVHEVTRRLNESRQVRAQANVDRINRLRA